MSGVIILPGVPIAGVAGPGGDASRLLSPEPREVWIGTANAAIDIDLGGVRTIDTIYLGYTSLPVAATLAVSTATAMGANFTLVKPPAPARAPDSAGPWHHCLVRLPAPVDTRFLRLSVNSADQLYTAGILAVGQAFEKHRERTGGRTLVDTGNRTDLVTGGFGIGDGVTKAQFSFSFIDLTDAETARLWRIAKDFGTRRPLLVVEDADLPAAQNDAIHWGMFERFSEYESQEAGATRWQFAHQEWL